VKVVVERLEVDLIQKLKNTKEKVIRVVKGVKKAKVKVLREDKW